MMSSGHQSASDNSHYSNTKSSISHSSNQTLELVLGEKNKLIEKLKQQIINQRAQLDFYLKRELETNEMEELSKTCTVEMAEENMVVSLAVNKFCRELGVKTRLMHVYERYCDAEERVNFIIQTLETILEEVITKMRAFMTPNDLKDFLGNFDINTNHLELFNLITNSTILLRKELVNFRNSCERLINIEDKRNAIVEQVCALPPDEKAICNYLVGIQMEKLELEHVIREMSKTGKIPNKEDLDEIDAIETNLKGLHDKFGWDCDESRVSKMLEKVYTQAMSLLALSKEQKEKYTLEINHLRKENVKLREIIQRIKCKNPDKRMLPTDFNDIERLHDIIKQTINDARKFEMAKGEELRKKSEECELLKHKLTKIVSEKTQLEELLNQNDWRTGELYKSEVENLKHIQQKKNFLKLF